MKRLNLFFLLIFIIFNSSVSAQNETFKILLGKDEAEILKYYNSLKNLFPDNTYLAIEKSTTVSGSKMLILELPTDRDKKVDFVTVSSVFYRNTDGREICTKQLFIYDNNEVYENLAFVKDNFKQISSNKWEKIVSNNVSIIATYDLYTKQSSTIEFKFKFNE